MCREPLCREQGSLRQAHLSHKLKVSFVILLCPSSIVSLPLSVVRQQFVYKQQTIRWIVTKLYRTNPWVVPFQSCSKNSISCRIVVAIICKKEKLLKNLLGKNYWSDFKIIRYKWSLGDPLPNLLKLFSLVKKHGCQGA